MKSLFAKNPARVSLNRLKSSFVSVSWMQVGILLIILPAAFGATPVFVDRTEALGLGVLDPANAGANACWFDYNNDGLVDLNAGGRIWENLDGTGFVKRVGGVGRCVAADFDNDGWNDFFSWSQLKLYRNNAGQGKIKVELPAFSTNYIAGSACWGDFNGDGWVDLYVAGYENWDLGITYPDLLLVNSNGLSFAAAWSNSAYRARGVTACDFDEDDDLDIYVSNYRLQPNRLWLNNSWAGLSDGAATYNAVATSPGYAGAHSIGSCWGDFDNSGHFDLFVGNFAHAGQPESRFLRNRGSAHNFYFEDMGTCGVTYQESYACPAAGDFDNDGLLDLFFTTVYGIASYGIPNFPKLFQNQGSFVFTDATSLGLDGIDPTYQAAWGDYDNDGDLDLMTGNRLFENQGNAGSWLKVRLHGDGIEVNRAAIGAQVRIHLGGDTLSRQIEAGTGQGNQNDLTLHFGLGSHTDPVDLEIVWPNGCSQTLSNQVLNALATATFETPDRGGVSMTAARPVDNVLVDINETNTVRGIIRIDDTGTNATNRRVLGQTFKLNHTGPEVFAVITNVVLKLGRNFDYNNGRHELQLAVMKDTDGNGLGDTQVGPTYLYDFSCLHGFKNNYLGLRLDYPAVIETGTRHAVEFWYAHADPTHTTATLVEEGYTAANLQFWRGNTNDFTDGKRIEADATMFTTNFPVGEAMKKLHTQDMNLVLQGYMAEETVNPAFIAWAAQLGLTGSDALMTADPDGDDDDNFTEYIFGGGPTNATARAVRPVNRIAEPTGVPWFEYIYARRASADSGLEYKLELTENLITGPWTNSGYTVDGVGILDDEMEAVTNRVPMDLPLRFIRLDVQNK